MSLTGVRVLLVEDEPLQRIGLEDMLADLGCVLAGSEGALRAALDIAQTGQFDIAILDVNLAGQRIDPVCDVLVKRDIPFIFTTGYGESGLANRDRAAAVLAKPYALEDLKAALEAALAARP